MRGPAARPLLALLLALVLAPALRAAGLEASLQQRIRAATFEVVQKRPDDGDVTYDRPLPLELIPYQQRIDPYRSIGTAFAIGANRYVTASHVFSLGMGSQFGPPALRDAAGKVYPVDQVWKFSDREDFVEFSLQNEPAGVQPLELGPPPALNDTVYAVGNALGEGVVIRDGVYTSDTPEEESGEWKWMRFSAAASPGNSGGPLIDQSGRLIGVVLRKSASENLNYALPIERVTGTKEGEGLIAGRAPVRLPILDAAETLEVRQKMRLPMRPADFYAEVQRITGTHVVQAQRKLLDDNRERLFPNGPKSSQLLHTGLFAPFPRVVHEGQDGLWVATGEQAQSFQLDHNGFVQLNGGIVRLRRPDDVTLASLYADSKLYMDLLLKGYAVRRQVGSESVKVTSLGKAQWSDRHTDAWGRTWQIFGWNEPWVDQVLVAMSLPTPEGYVALIAPASSGFRQTISDAQALMSDYLLMSIGGTLWQWQEFLAQKGVAPHLFDSLQIEIDPDQRIQFHSRRCELIVTPELVPLSRDSNLWLKLNFFHDGDKVVWDVGGVSAEESSQKHNWAEFWRIAQPDAELPESFQSLWHKLQAGDFPYNGTVNNANGATRISAAAAAPGGKGSSARVRYTLAVQREGDQTQEFMAPKLELLKRSFRAQEQ